MITSLEKHKIDELVEKEYVKSLRKYGNWNDRYYITMLLVIFAELWEVLTAFIRSDFYGNHGVIAEASQVVACVDKLIVQVMRREGESDGIQ